MIKEHQPHLNNNAVGMATGMFIGSMLGAVTMLLLAPQSGKRTRAKIQLKSIEIRDKANELLEEKVDQIRLESKKLTKSGRDQARELIRHGQDVLAEQFAHASKIVETGKKTILGS